MIAHIPRTPKLLPPEYEPYRRLLAAVAVRAITDYAKPPQNLTLAEQESARRFVIEQTALIAELAQINEKRIKQLLGV